MIRAKGSVLSWVLSDRSDRGQLEGTYLYPAERAPPAGGPHGRDTRNQVEQTRRAYHQLLRRKGVKVGVGTVRRVMEEAGYRPPKVDR